MADVLVRPGTAADIPAFVALGRAVVPPTYGPIDAAYAQKMLDEWWTPEVFATSLQRNTHLVAERDGEVVALTSFGRLVQSYRDFPHVTGEREVMWKLYVHPDHQGLGIGSRLLAEIEALVEAIEAGAMVSTGARVGARDFLAGLPVLGESDLYDAVCDRLGATNDGERAAALELALEGLYLARKIGKDTDAGETVYG